MATKTNAPQPEVTIIDNVDALQARMKEMRKAQANGEQRITPSSQ